QLFVSLTAAVEAPAFDISPPEVVIAPGESRQFHVVTSNLPNASARWSTAAGGVTADGTFSAPTTASASTITAQSFADSTLQASSLITIQQPLPAVLPAPAVVNGASFQPGAVAPGEVVAIFGAGIGPAEVTGAQLNAQGR